MAQVDAQVEVQGDGFGDRPPTGVVPAIGIQAERGACADEREALRRGGGAAIDEAEIVQERRDLQQLLIEGDAVVGGENGGPNVRALRVKQDHRRGLLRAYPLGVPADRRVGDSQRIGVDLG